MEANKKIDKQLKQRKIRDLDNMRTVEDKIGR